MANAFTYDHASSAAARPASAASRIGASASSAAPPRRAPTSGAASDADGSGGDSQSGQEDDYLNSAAASAASPARSMSSSAVLARRYKARQTRKQQITGRKRGVGKRALLEGYLDIVSRASIAHFPRLNADFTPVQRANMSRARQLLFPTPAVGTPLLGMWHLRKWTMTENDSCKKACLKAGVDELELHLDGLDDIEEAQSRGDGGGTPAEARPRFELKGDDLAIVLSCLQAHYETQRCKVVREAKAAHAFALARMHETTIAHSLEESERLKVLATNAKRRKKRVSRTTTGSRREMRTSAYASIVLSHTLVVRMRLATPSFPPSCSQMLKSRQMYQKLQVKDPECPYTPQQHREHASSLVEGNISESSSTPMPNLGTMQFTIISLYYRSDAMSHYLRDLEAFRRRVQPNFRERRVMPTEEDADGDDADMLDSSGTGQLPQTGSIVEIVDGPGARTIVDAAFADSILLNKDARWSVNVERLVECVNNHPHHSNYKDPRPPRQPKVGRKT
jgi:hypothetical protein